MSKSDRLIAAPQMYINKQHQQRAKHRKKCVHEVSVRASERASEHIQWSNWALAYLSKHKTKIVYCALSSLPFPLCVCDDRDRESRKRKSRSAMCALRAFNFYCCGMYCVCVVYTVCINRNQKLRRDTITHTKWCTMCHCAIVCVAMCDMACVRACDR